MTEKHFCEICKYETPFKHNFSLHIKTKRHQNKEKNIGTDYRCKTCNKPYSSMRGLQLHENICITNRSEAVLPSTIQNEVIQNTDVVIILNKIQGLSQQLDEIQTKIQNSSIIANTYIQNFYSIDKKDIPMEVNNSEI